MKQKSYRLLLCGNIYDNHIVRFIKHIHEINSTATIDVLTRRQNGKTVSADARNAVRAIYYYDEIYKGPRFFKVIYRVTHQKKTISGIFSQNSYDIINIHYPTFYWGFVVSEIVKSGAKILITPWGSDVYRIGCFELLLLKKVYRAADYVCGLGNRFTKDVARLFSVPQEKIVRLTLASETIDYIVANRGVVSSEYAKTKLGVPGTYVITCGYNGNNAQNHSAILSAVQKIKDQLPENLVLFFPVTYGGAVSYVKELKDKVADSGIKSLFFEQYLSVSELFIVIQASDMFVHVQTTDANSGSLKEYIYCDKKVVNGGWLTYDDLNQYTPLPYFVAPSLEDLGESILNAYYSDAHLVPAAWKKYFETGGYGYWAPLWDDFYASCAR